MAVCPFALYEPAGTPGGPITPRVVIIHSEATKGHARPHSGLEWHFWIGFDGSIEQLVDTGRRADANNKANSFAVSIETEDLGDPNNEPWTSEQLGALVRLVHWICETHDIPVQVADGPYGSGIGYHTMWGSPSAWTPVAKSCPGRVRIEQFDAVLLPALFGQAPLPAPVPEPTPAPAPAPPPSAPPTPPAERMFRQGDRGQDVADWQAYLGLATDGRFGPETHHWTARFQRLAGLSPDGVVGPATKAARARVGAWPNWPGRVLKRGVSGADVSQWQARMAQRGWAISVDGAYGPQSEGVCRTFQAEKRLGVDGEVGPDTWDAAWLQPVTR